MIPAACGLFSGPLVAYVGPRNQQVYDGKGVGHDEAGDNIASDIDALLPMNLGETVTNAG